MNNDKEMLKLIHRFGNAFTKAHLYFQAAKIWHIGIKYRDKLSYINLAQMYLHDLSMQNISGLNLGLKVSAESCRALMTDMWQTFPQETVPFLQSLITMRNIPQDDKNFYKRLLNKKEILK